MSDDDFNNFLAETIAESMATNSTTARITPTILKIENNFFSAYHIKITQKLLMNRYLPKIQNG